MTRLHVLLLGLAGLPLAYVLGHAPGLLLWVALLVGTYVPWSAKLAVLGLFGALTLYVGLAVGLFTCLETNPTGACAASLYYNTPRLFVLWVLNTTLTSHIVLFVLGVAVAFAQRRARA